MGGWMDGQRASRIWLWNSPFLLPAMFRLVMKKNWLCLQLKLPFALMLFKEWIMQILIWALKTKANRVNTGKGPIAS